MVSINNLSRIEVLNTPTPESPASALAGTVNMVTRSSFERAKPLFQSNVYLSMRDNAKSFKKAPGAKPGLTRNIYPGFDFSYSAPVNKKCGFSISAGDSTRYSAQDRSQAADHIGRAHIRPDDIAKNFRNLGQVGFSAGKETLGGLGIAEDDRQGLVDFVCQGARQFADGCDAREVGEFIALAGGLGGELVLGGRVHAHQNHLRRVVDFHLGRDEEKAAEGSVFIDEVEFEFRMPGFPRVPPGGFRGLAILVSENLPKKRSVHTVGRIQVQRLAGIRTQDPALGRV
jgi:hypothetical protein